MLATDGSWQIFKQVGGFGRFIRQAKGNIGAGKDGLHVPDASADRAGSSCSCPICGMALEPKTPIGTDEEENAELRDMTRRFWIGAALALPVFILAMAHLFPNAPMWVASDWSRWTQFILSTP